VAYLVIVLVYAYDVGGVAAAALGLDLLDVPAAEEHGRSLTASASVEPVVSTYSFRSARLRRSTATTCHGRSRSSEWLGRGSDGPAGRERVVDRGPGFLEL
jgi:hypothetical protein